MIVHDQLMPLTKPTCYVQSSTSDGRQTARAIIPVEVYVINFSTPSLSSHLHVMKALQMVIIQLQTVPQGEGMYNRLTGFREIASYARQLRGLAHVHCRWMAVIGQKISVAMKILPGKPSITRDDQGRCTSPFSDRVHSLGQ